MNANPLFSVVIPTYNRPEMLSNCLAHVYAGIRQLPAESVEVIVTDNSTNDASERLVRQRFPAAIWTKGPGDGPARNRNHGVQRASGRWLVFVDDDCLPTEAWLKAFEQAVSGASGTKVFEGCTVGDREQRRFDEEAPLNPQGGHLWACNFVIDRALYLQLGGFCELFPYGYEDVDLRLRIQKAGEPMQFVPDAVVCHPFRQVRGLGFYFRSTRSFNLLVHRHPDLIGQTPWASVFWNLLRRIKQMCVPALRYRFRGIWYVMGVIALQTYAEVRATFECRLLASKPD